MAETSKSGAAGNTAMPRHGDHDRVVMLSLKADGTPDQHNPEIIGDKEFALEAAKVQFAEQAVSAIDQRERGVSANNGGAETVEQDPGIAELQAKQEAAQESAMAAAESAVNALYTEDEKLQGTPAVDGSGGQSGMPGTDTGKSASTRKSAQA